MYDNMPIIHVLLFIICGTCIWISTFGFLALLAVLTLYKNRKHSEIPFKTESLPKVAIVIPVLNEADSIRAKILDILKTTYPEDLFSVIFVDGGSEDFTRRNIEEVSLINSKIKLLNVPQAKCKADQINYALREVEEDIIVFTDIDARLAPNCIERLVRCLLQDPKNAVVGAYVEPRTKLREERLHWWLLNLLWYFEGEAWGAAKITGVCFASRRGMISNLRPVTMADDLHLALNAIRQGHRVRICKQARAEEIRVPHTLREMIRFRLYRGVAYLHELDRARTVLERWGIMIPTIMVHRWYIKRVPFIFAIFLIMGSGLIFKEAWLWPTWFLMLFGSSLMVVLWVYKISKTPEDSIAVQLLNFFRMAYVDGYSMAVISLLKKNKTWRMNARQKYKSPACLEISEI